MRMLVVWLGLIGMSALCTPAMALNHLQANRLHLLNAGICTQATGPLWIMLGSGRPAPGFINVDAPGFDQIGALLTGNLPAEPVLVLESQNSGCTVIASFYKNAQAVGAWVVPPSKVRQLLSILQRNG